MFRPVAHNACSIIFSHTDADVLFGVSSGQTVRLSLKDGSVTEFSGHAGSHYCLGDAMALNDDSSVLFVGYHTAECIVAWDVVTLQLMWKMNFEGRVCSISHHDGVVYAAAANALFSMLSGRDGSVVRQLARAPVFVAGHCVFTGMLCGI